MTDVMQPPLAMPPFAHTPRPYQGPSREEVLALRRRHVNPAVFTLYRDPLMIVEGSMQYVFDETGRVEEAARFLGMRSLDRTARLIGVDWSDVGGG